MDTRKSRALLGLAAVGLLVLTACGPEQPDAQPTQAPPPGVGRGAPIPGMPGVDDLPEIPEGSAVIVVHLEATVEGAPYRIPVPIDYTVAVLRQGIDDPLPGFDPETHEPIPGVRPVTDEAAPTTYTAVIVPGLMPANIVVSVRPDAMIERVLPPGLYLSCRAEDITLGDVPVPLAGASQGTAPPVSGLPWVTCVFPVLPV